MLIKKKDIYRLKRCLRYFKTKDHLCLFPDLLSFELSFQNDLSCPPVLGLGSFSLFLFSSFDFKHHCIGFFFFCTKFLDYLDFSSCPQALFWHLWWLRIFFLPFSVAWAFSIIEVFSMFLALASNLGCDPSQGYFQKKLLGSKGDCKGYILALWKDYQRWLFFIPNSCI